MLRVLPTSDDFITDFWVEFAYFLAYPFPRKQLREGGGYTFVHLAVQQMAMD